MLDMRDRHGVIPAVLAPEDGDFPQKCRENGIETFCAKFYMWQGNTSFKSRIKGIIKCFLNRLVHFRNIRRLLKDKHFDIIHTNSSCSEIGGVLSQSFSVPHVWHIREFGLEDYNMDYFLPDFCVRHYYSQAASVIAISRQLYDSYINRRRLCSPNNTRIIYNGLRVPPAYDKRPPSGTIHFCMTGLLFSSKNQESAIRACAKLSGKFMLHIIGSGSGEYTDSLKHLADTLGVCEHVKFWGYRKDVDVILRDMDVGLMLSTREAFGRVTVEYMLNYMPVIGVDTGATPEIVLDCETGYIVPLNDDDRLAQVMQSFIGHPENIPAMGMNGRERAVQNFSLEGNTDEIYSLY